MARKKFLHSFSCFTFLRKMLPNEFYKTKTKKNNFESGDTDMR